MNAPRNLPVMPPLKSAHSCRRCGRWLEDEWNRTEDEDERASLSRQMGDGRCDDCTRREAAEMFEDAAAPAGTVGTVTPQQGLRFVPCSACEREMSGTRCAVAARIIDGLTVMRAPYRKPFAVAGDTCNDCNTPVGAMHHRRCDQDRCPVPDCGRQAAFCEHQTLGWLADGVVILAARTLGVRRVTRRRRPPR